MSRKIVSAIIVVLLAAAAIAYLYLPLRRRKNERAELPEPAPRPNINIEAPPLIPVLPAGRGANSGNYSFRATGSAINLLLWGLGMENSQYDPDTGVYNGFPVGGPLYAHIQECGFQVYGFPGTIGNHYWTAEVTPINTPTGNGGYICVDGSPSAQCNTPMPTDFYPDFIQLLQNLGGGKVVLNANPNNYNSSDFHAVINDANSKTDGVVGVTDAIEFESPEWNDSPLNGDAAGVRDAGTTINNDLHAAYPSILLAQDWRGLQPGTPISNDYTNTVQQTSNCDAFRIYCSPSKLCDLPPGETAEQYLQAIYTGIFEEFPSVVEGIKSATGKAVIVSQLYAPNSGAIADNFLSLTFLSLYKIQEILYEADHNGSVLWSMYARVDDANMKATNMNFQGTLLTMLKEAFVEGNQVSELVANSVNNVYGFASLDEDNSGVIFVWNGNPFSIAPAEILTGTGYTLTSMRNFYSDALDGTTFTDASNLMIIPPYSVSILRINQ